MAHYKNKGAHAPVVARDIRWKGEYADHLNRPPAKRKGPRHQKPKQK